MKNLISSMAASVLILFTLRFSNHFLVEVEGGTANDLIETTCKNTQNYQLCIKILRSDPRSPNADITGLALILVDAVKKNTISTINTIEKLKKSKPEYKKQLNECMFMYKDVVLGADIPEAVEALTKGNPKFAENGMADSAIEAESCEDGFKKGPSKWSSPLAKENQAVYDLSVVARAIIRNLLRNLHLHAA